MTTQNPTEYQSITEDLQVHNELKNNLADLQRIIEKMPYKKGKIFTQWIKTKNNYLQWEESFDPTRLRAYSRGEIVFSHFGFNVGTEYGGVHYAVVMKNSSKTNEGLNVIPLTSFKDEREVIEGKELPELTTEEIESMIHKNSIYLGNISGINEKLSIALVDQLQYVSKIRVIRPKKQQHKVSKIGNELLDKLDDKIRRLYTKAPK